jgi:hypothetical protein
MTISDSAFVQALLDAAEAGDYAGRSRPLQKSSSWRMAMALWAPR